MKIARIGTLCLSMFVGLTQSSRADIVSETLMFAGATIATAPVSGAESQNFAAQLSLDFAQFDPALGTLNSIALEYRFDLRHSFVIAGVNGSSGVTMGGTFSAAGNAYGGIGGGGGGGGGPGMHDAPFQITTDSLITPESNPPAFNAFVGLGDVTVMYDTTGEITNTPPTEVSSELTLRNTSFITVTYDYTPVPEPSSIALLSGLAIPAVVLGRRRRACRR